MFRASENGAAVGALALEHGACIMQAVGQHVQSGVPPRHEPAIVPDDALEPIIGFISHGASSSRVLSLARRPLFAQTVMFLPPGAAPGMILSAHENAAAPIAHP